MAPVCDLSATALVGTRRDLASEISYLLAVLEKSRKRQCIRLEY